MPIISQLQTNAKTILVVDDDDFVTAYVHTLLNKLGYAAKVCHTGMQALAMAVKIKPDCILLDLDMPELDGFEVLRLRQKMPEIVDIPIVVLTASHRKEDVERSLALGAKGYIAKPVDEKRLAQRLDRLVPSPLFSQPDTTAVHWPKPKEDRVGMYPAHSNHG
jgi:CheY-like chemotaxis protein